MRISTFVSAIAFSASSRARPMRSMRPLRHGSDRHAAAKAAKSAECSKQADAKGLHGAERRNFREECKKAK